MSLIRKLISINNKLKSVLSDINTALGYKGSDEVTTLNDVSTAIYNIPTETGGSLIDTSKITDFSYFCTQGIRFDVITRYDTSNGVNFHGLFYYSAEVKSVPLIDTSKGINFTQMFGSCYYLESIPQYDTSNGIEFTGMFNDCWKIGTIPQLDTSNGLTFNYMFSRCNNLKHISFVENCIKANISFADSPLLTPESVQSIFDGLATVTTAQTLTLNANTKILQSQVDSANAKGWTVAGGTVVSEEEYYG